MQFSYNFLFRNEAEQRSQQRDPNNGSHYVISRVLDQSEQWLRVITQPVYPMEAGPGLSILDALAAVGAHCALPSGRARLVLTDNLTDDKFSNKSIYQQSQLVIIK